MSEATQAISPIEPVRASWTYTTEELELSWKLRERRKVSQNEPYHGHFQMIFVVAGLAISVGLSCFFFGAVEDLRNPTVTLLCGLAVYAAFWIQEWLVKRYHRRLRSKQLHRATTKKFSAQIDGRGLRVQFPYATYTYLWPAIEQVTTSEGLIFFWSEDAEALTIPLRAIAEVDQARAQELAKTRGVTLPPADDAAVGDAD